MTRIPAGTAVRPTLRSDAMMARASRSIPGGVDSNVRLDAPRIVFERASGAWLWDVDGNDYVDFLLGQGPAFLGHAPAGVLAAVELASRQGLVFGAQHPLEIEAAESFLEATRWPERVRFGMTGTEMVQVALRLARAATGRTEFVRFAGHYHGWLDDVLITVADGIASPASDGQLASALEASHVLTWNDASLLERTLAERGERIAAVIMEPAMFNAGSILPRAGYLERARELCDRHGAVLIFDEVISGFRVARGGAVERFGVVPDLAVYGKAVASGWPVAALAGRAAIMEPLGTGLVNHSGTFNGNVMGMAATVATLRTILDDPPYARIERLGARLMDGLRGLAEETGLALNVQGLPMAFNLSIGGPAVAHDHVEAGLRDRSRYARLADALVEAGVWVARRGIWYLSAAHRGEEIDAALSRARPAIGRLLAGPASD